MSQLQPSISENTAPNLNKFPGNINGEVGKWGIRTLILRRTILNFHLINGSSNSDIVSYFFICMAQAKIVKTTFVKERKEGGSAEWKSRLGPSHSIYVCYVFSNQF